MAKVSGKAKAAKKEARAANGEAGTKGRAKSTERAFKKGGEKAFKAATAKAIRPAGGAKAKKAKKALAKIYKAK